MRVRLTTLLAVVLVTVMLVAAPALAEAGGNPTAGSCGFGNFSETLRDDDVKKLKIDPRPGAGEASELHPEECPGKD